MDTTLPQIINTPEFLGAVMSKVGNVSPELLTPEEFPKVAQHIFQGMSDYLQKEAGFTEENVISFTIGLAMTNPDFNEGFSKQAGLLDGLSPYGSDVAKKITHPGDAIGSAVNTIKGTIGGAAAGFQHPDAVNAVVGFANKHPDLVKGITGVADQASGAWNNYIKPFWDKNKDSIINAGIGALAGAGGNLLMGGNSPISAGLVGAAGGYLAGPTVRDGLKRLTEPASQSGPNQATVNKQELQAEKVKGTVSTAQAQQNRLNNETSKTAK